MTEPVGKPLPRAKPISLTFYDTLRDYPYTTTFYVRDETSEEDCHRLIAAVKALSVCVLGMYKIGYKQYIMPDYHKALETISPSAMGTHKWLISYHTPNANPRSNTIPGWSPEYGMDRNSKVADRNHPLWETFLTVFTELCVSKEGEPITGMIELGRTASNWPPKGAKKTRR